MILQDDLTHTDQRLRVIAYGTLAGVVGTITTSWGTWAVLLLAEVGHAPLWASLATVVIAVLLWAQMALFTISSLRTWADYVARIRDDDVAKYNATSNADFASDFSVPSLARPSTLRIAKILVRFWLSATLAFIGLSALTQLSNWSVLTQR
jgi:hypothetical protein